MDFNSRMLYLVGPAVPSDHRLIGIVKTGKSVRNILKHDHGANLHPKKRRGVLSSCVRAANLSAIDPEYNQNT